MQKGYIMPPWYATQTDKCIIEHKTTIKDKK